MTDNILAKRVTAAVKQIKPERGRINACRETVTRYIRFIPAYAEERHVAAMSLTIPGKAALGDLARGLRLVDKALRNKSLHPKIREVVGSFFPEGVDLKEFTNDLYTLAEIKIGKGMLKGPAPKNKRMAIIYARRLLNKFCPTPEIADDARKGSRFCKLAAILYGDPGIDLSFQCKDYLRRRKKFSDLLATTRGTNQPIERLWEILVEPVIPTLEPEGPQGLKLKAELDRAMAKIKGEK